MSTKTKKQAVKDLMKLRKSLKNGMKYVQNTFIPLLPNEIIETPILA
jgi:hypothetical protein